MSSLPKKIIFLLIIGLLGYWVIGLFSSPAHAQSPGDIFSQQTLDQKNFQESTARQQEKDNPDEVQVFSTRVNNQLLGDTMYNTLNMIVCTNEEVCTNNPQAQEKGKPLSALGGINFAIGKLYEYPAASGIAYTFDLLKNAGFVKTAYAQGIGFTGLTSFLPFWKVTRNIAYLILIIVMVAIGFMIIFRMKIDPKTVITVQAALPKIILTLLVITFSYAIVGFLIDIMYLIMAIGISLVVSGFGGSVEGATVVKLQQDYMTAGVRELFKSVVVWPSMPTIRSIWHILLGIGGTPALAYGVGTLLGISIISGLLPLAPGLPMLIMFIVGLGLLFTFIRLLMLLLNSYIQLLIGLILGPLLLLGEAIPGRSAFSGWLLNIIANLVVFPATALVIIFSIYFMATGQTQAGTLNPPFLGLLTPETNFHFLLGLGIMFLAPNLVAQVKKAFHPKPALPITAGTALSPVTGSTQTIMGAASQLYYLAQIKSMIPGLGKK